MAIGQVKTIDNEKRVLPLAGSVSTGNPVGSLLYTYKKIQPRNYLYCDGSTFNAGQYPALAMYLGGNVLPDYRECGFVGAEENTTDQIETHDVYAQGEFKDDQIQNITGEISSSSTDYSVGASTNANTVSSGALNAERFDSKAFSGTSGSAVYFGKISFDASRSARTGTTTHGKRKAVYVYIKAVDGVDISDEDTFLVTVKNYVDGEVDGVEDKLETAQSYSETETWTGGYWYDGKKIYKKTFTGLSVNIRNTWAKVGTITNIGNIVICNATGVADSYVSNIVPFSRINNANGDIYCYANSWNFIVNTVTIEYTKTTD